MKKFNLPFFYFYLFSFLLLPFFPLTSPSVKGAELNKLQSPQSTLKPVQKISFPKKTIKVYSNTTYTNKPIIQPNNGQYNKITWKCTSPKYFHISSKGVVSIKKEADGKKCTVTATVYSKNGSSKSASYTILVHQRAKKISLHTKQDFLLVGKPLKIFKTITPSKTHSKKVQWKSSRPDYAVISKSGVVRAKNAGTGKKVTFTAATTDGSSLKVSLTLKIINPKKPMVALTFDDGPKAGYTEQILNCLKKYNAHATFFVIGSSINQSTKSILNKAYKQGNEIGNHSFSHANLIRLGPQGVKNEIQRTSRLIRQATGVLPNLVRAPYGSINSTIKNTVHAPLIQWSIDTLDWKTKNTSSTVSCVLNQIKDGSIVLMHDIHGPTIDAALQIIPSLVKRGYQLCTISELAKYKGISLKNGMVYYSLTK